MKTVIVAQSLRGHIDVDQTLFSRGGITLLTAATAEDALELHRVRQADLIVADQGMPVMGAAKLCARIRADELLRDVSVIAVCERTGGGASECQKAGANAILLRPLDRAELFAKVSHLLMVQDRMAVRVPLRITVNASTGQATFIGISRDLSISGMLLESGRLLQIGERLNCTFTIGSRVVSVDCVVVRAHEEVVGVVLWGVKFINLNAKTFVLLEQQIKGGLQG